MIIRRANANDLGAIAVVHHASIIELCRNHYSAEQLADWTAALLPVAYAELLRTREMWVAQRDDSLLGFGVLDQTASLINATYVRPDATHHGIGRRLIASLEAAAKAGGGHVLHLNATLNAIGFYAALGYVNDGPAANRLPSGIDLPCVQMHKRL